MNDPRSDAPFSSSVSAGRVTIAIACSILLTLLCISILVVLYICRCAESRGRRIEREQRRQEEELERVRSGFGLSKRSIGKLPVVSYQQLVEFKGGSENLECCAVCLAEFRKEDKRIRHLPRCAHSFHSSCIDMWFYSHNSCPVCRDCLLDPESLVHPGLGHQQHEGDHQEQQEQLERGVEVRGGGGGGVAVEVPVPS